MMENGQKVAFGERESGRVLGGGDGRCGGFNLVLVEVVATGDLAELEVLGGGVVLAHGLDQLARDARFFVVLGKVRSVAGSHAQLALRSQRVRWMSRHSSFAAGRSRTRERLGVDGSRVERALI